MKAKELSKLIRKHKYIYAAIRLTENDRHLIRQIKTELLISIKVIDEETPEIEFDAVVDRDGDLIVGW